MINSQEMYKLMELQRLSGMDKFHKLTVKQVLEKEKLLNLLKLTPHIGMSDEAAEMIVDHLIANGVTIPVYCEDCKHCKDSYCYRKVFGNFEPVIVTPKGFCAHGERKDDDA